KLVKYKKSYDCFAWRCLNKHCSKNKSYFNIRTDSFFEGFICEFKVVLQIVTKYACRQPRHSIKSSLDVSDSLIVKVINKISNLIPSTDFTSKKLGGPFKIIQIDETMLNFKVKSHRGRSPHNRSDALCIIEKGMEHTKAFATIIPDKKESTLVPIICSQVAENSIIWTDEFKSYYNLSKYNFIHNTVCHKYQFINHSTGVNTQAVESFNNELKLEIKRRKGIKNEKRNDFLKEFCFIYNNKDRLFDAVLDLINVQ
ncbi:hypothetical protein H311_01095, partial [Anncaliia algerae PRA109]